MLNAGYSLFLPIFVSLADALLTITPHFPENATVYFEGQAFFHPGQSLSLSCTSDDTKAKVIWKKLNQTTGNWSLPIHGSQNVFSPIKPNSGGNYSCSDGLQTKYFFVNVLSADSITPMSITTNGTSYLTLLECKQNFAVKPFPLIWAYNVSGTNVLLNEHPAEDRNYTVSETKGYALEIRSNGRYPKKTGSYFCKLNTTAFFNLKQPLQQRVTYQSTPDVRIYEGSDSRYAIEKKPLTITCLHSDANSTGVKWMFDNVTIVDFEEPLVDCSYDKQLRCSAKYDRYSFSRDENLENDSFHSGKFEKTSVLRLQSLEPHDRGRFYCFARNSYGENNATIFVRVKDQYAALYPFLGVVGEILLLSLIICCCERRRRRKELREEEAQLMNESLPYDSSATATVRNRK